MKGVRLLGRGGPTAPKTGDEEHDFLAAHARKEKWWDLRPLAQRNRNTFKAMKSAVIPQVRVDSALRAGLEAFLEQRETLSEFVLASVRSAVETRRVQQRFHERGQASWEHYQRTGESVAAEEVLAVLQAKLGLRRTQLGG